MPKSHEGMLRRVILSIGGVANAELVQTFCKIVYQCGGSVGQSRSEQLSDLFAGFFEIQIPLKNLSTLQKRISKELPKCATSLYVAEPPSGVLKVVSDGSAWSYFLLKAGALDHNGALLSAVNAVAMQHGEVCELNSRKESPQFAGNVDMFHIVFRFKLPGSWTKVEVENLFEQHLDDCFYVEVDDWDEDDGFQKAA